MGIEKKAMNLWGYEEKQNYNMSKGFKLGDERYLDPGVQGFDFYNKEATQRMKELIIELDTLSAKYYKDTIMRSGFLSEFLILNLLGHKLVGGTHGCDVVDKEGNYCEYKSTSNNKNIKFKLGEFNYNKMHSITRNQKYYFVILGNFIHINKVYEVDSKWVVEKVEGALAKSRGYTVVVNAGITWINLVGRLVYSSKYGFIKEIDYLKDKMLHNKKDRLYL